MNVGVFTYDFYPIIGGQGRHLYELFSQNEIQKKTNLFIFSPSTNNLHNHFTLFEETTHSKLRNIEFSIRLNYSILSIINTYKLDIAHLHSGPGGLFLLRRLNIPTVFTCHHTYWQQFHYLDWQKWKIIFYYLERGGYSNASKIICVSPSTREIISAKYKIDQTVSLVVPNGINCQFNRNIVPEIKNNREILFVGRIDKRKGVDFLISAYEELIKNNPGILLHIVGEGKDRPKLQNYCLNKGLNIIFHGHLSDQEIFNLSKQASAQIIPSVFEGFGLVVLEAMSRGLPVIATNVDGIRDIITDGSNGILVDYGDKYLLAKRIQDLLINDDLAKRLVKNAYNSLENYKWENTYADTIHVYEELLS